MSRGNVRPAIRDKPVNADHRLTELERRSVGDKGAAPVVSGDRFPGFSFPGLIDVGWQSPPWYTTRPINFVLARISCFVAGTGNGTFDLNLNGSPVLSLTLASGETTHVYAAAFSVQIGDRLDATCIAAASQSIVSIQLEELA